MNDVMEADVCIVGAGIAGLFAACSLPDGRSVVILDKGTLGEGSSPLAQGGLAAAVGPEDSPQLHLADTVAAGAGLVDVRAAEVLCDEAPDRVRELVDLGCEFDRGSDGRLHLAREGGQSVGRSVHRADASGGEIVRALRAAARHRVRRVEAYAVGLAVAGGRCHGVRAIGDAGPVLVRAAATLLATGGAGALFGSTTNPRAATGDALALAWEAGARLADLEFVQFHPTALAVAGSQRPLLTEALRGAGAHLVDASGRRFLVGRHPDAELAPRHVVTAAILEAGRAFLDARHLGRDLLEEHFPTAVRGCAEHGFDLAEELVPVSPAAHYVIGGVQTDLDGRTSVPGLYAAGECAATGVHGANRMAGNSLAEAVVFGRRAAMAMAVEASPPGTGEGWERAPEPALAAEGGDDAGAVRARVIRAVTEGAGPIREATASAAAASELHELSRGLTSRSRRAAETRAMAMAGRLLVRAALAREETRGVHVRADHPGRDPSMDGLHLTWSRGSEAADLP